MNEPKFLFVEVNKRCNLRCNHCDFWKRNDDDAENYLSTEQLSGLVREFRSMGGESLVICGGEPMLDRLRYYDICDMGRAHGLRVCSVVNGTRIQTDFEASAMVLGGPSEVSISYDDFRESDHDYFRGVKGSWKMCNKAIRLMLEQRASHGIESFKIIVMGLIHGGNYLELPRFYDFVLNEIGADKLKLNFLQPSFGTTAAGLDPWFWKYSQIDPARLASVLDQCEKLFGHKYREAWRQSLFAYVRSIHEYERNLKPEPPKGRIIAGWGSGVELEHDLCNSYERNIMLDHYGRAGFCFSDCAPRTLVRTGPELRAWWEASEPARQEIATKGCRRLCGISHSVRREKCYES